MICTTTSASSFQCSSKAERSPSIERCLTDMIRLPSLEQQLPHVIEEEDDASVSLQTKDTCEQLRLPPPLPFFDRRSSAPPSLLRMDGSLSRGRSISPDRAAARPGRQFLGAVNMSQSMPNFHSSRSLHNRGVGYLLATSECGGAEGKHLRQTRVQEFEQLLDDL